MSELEEFVKLKIEKNKLVESRHNKAPLAFDGCLGHLIVEFGELIVAANKGTEQEIIDELVDLSNMCEFTYLSLRARRGK